MDDLDDETKDEVIWDEVICEAMSSASGLIALMAAFRRQLDALHQDEVFYTRMAELWRKDYFSFIPKLARRLDSPESDPKIVDFSMRFMTQITSLTDDRDFATADRLAKQMAQQVQDYFDGDANALG